MADLQTEFVTLPGRDWLAQALCGWHDAENGRLPGEPFPCGACRAQAAYVIEQATPVPLTDVLVRWGIDLSGSDAGFDIGDEFAEAIQENGAWRFIRDLRSAWVVDGLAESARIYAEGGDRG